MKITMLAHYYYPHNGGVERHVQFLTRELVRRGHKVTLVTSQHDQYLPEKEKIEGVWVYRIPYQENQTKKGIWAWMKVHRKLFEKADLVHVHDVYWWYLPTRLALLKIPTYTTFHGYEGADPPRWQAVVHRKVVESLSRGTIVVGAFMKKWYRAKPDVITYGATDMKKGRKINELSAVFIGRLSEDTGIMTYLELLSKIKRKVSLDIYGEGPLLNQVRQMIEKKKLTAAVHGWTDDPGEALRKSRWAFVSRYLAILEAMKVGRLVVAHYNNEIKHDYLTCHPAAEKMIIFNNPAEAAKRLDGLDEMTEIQLIKEASVWANYQTWSSMADEYERLWKK